MEQQIYTILVDMQKDIKDLKNGQERLEKNQEKLEQNQEKLEKNQEKLEKNQEKLEKRQDRFSIDLGVIDKKQNTLIQEVKEIKEDQRIMKINIAQILEEQIKVNKKFEKHEKESNIRYKELDYRITVLEA